jgi:uncharacterized repeat protein (TIGR01451 family)
VGQFAHFEVTVTNQGDATARNIVIRDRFDAGLKPPISNIVDNTIYSSAGQLRDLAPGESDTIELSFEVLRTGNLCHEVTIRDSDGYDRVCITGIEPPPVVQPQLEVEVVAPARHFVGELANFRIVVKNTGQVPVTNIVVENEHDPALAPNRATNEQLRWNIDRLEVGGRREFEVEYKCLAPTALARSRAFVRADGLALVADEGSLEILTAPTPATPSGPNVRPSDGTSAVAQPSLRLSILEQANPTRVGERMMLTVRLENLTQQPQREITLRVLFPPQLPPDLSLIQSPVRVQMEPPTPAGTAIRFDAISELRAQEVRTVAIPVNVTQTGEVYVYARVESPGLAQPLQQSTEKIVIQPRNP